MKRIGLIALIAVFVTASVVAQELKLGGEVKTGILWETGQDTGLDPDVNKVRMASKDDADDKQRFRINLEYDNGNGFGIKMRIQQPELTDSTMVFPYYFGYGNFFENNLTVSIGRLGGSPWSTGGPEMWKELENSSSGGGGGMRIEYKPSWVPEEYGKFNVGFVLNWFDGTMEGAPEDITLADILEETVLGISWDHEKFLVRFAYRLDSRIDIRERGTEGLREGQSMLYRLEERMLKNYLPGMQIWAIGFWQGIGSDPKDEMYLFQNWLFAQYAPDQFTAQLRFGLDTISDRSLFYVKPSFYYNLFDKLISVGTMFGYCQDFGEGKVNKGSPFSYIELEPKIQINFSNSYIAFAYNWKQEYKAYYAEAGKSEPIRQTQWMNLRFCIYF